MNSFNEYFMVRSFLVFSGKVMDRGSINSIMFHARLHRIDANIGFYYANLCKLELFYAK